MDGNRHHSVARAAPVKAGASPPRCNPTNRPSERRLEIRHIAGALPVGCERSGGALAVLLLQNQQTAAVRGWSAFHRVAGALHAAECVSFGESAMWSLR